MKKIFIIIFLNMSLISCALNQNTTTYDPDVNTGLITLTPVIEQVPQETFEQNISLLKNNLIKIEVENLYNQPFWDLNSEYLFFSKNFGEIYSYNINTHKLSLVEDILKEEIFTATPSIPTQLPPHFWAATSPYSNKTIYFEAADTPPTPIIEDGYPIKDELINAPLWLWNNGQQTKISNILGCDPMVSNWTSDEKKVILVESQIPQITCIDADTQVWVIDLTTLKIKPLFSRHNYPNLRVYGLDPTEKNLLYGLYLEGIGANLYLLDITTLEEKAINAPVIKFVDWLDENNMLVIYNNHNGLPYSLGILNLNNLSFTNLTEEFTGKEITSYKLSPNKKWVAITTGPTVVSYSDLWLIKLHP